MKNSKLESENDFNQISTFANLLSGFYASPLVYKTVNLSGSYKPVVTLTNTIEYLFGIEAKPVAFKLVLAWFNIVGHEVPEVLAGIDPYSELAASFVNELLLDLEDIIDEDLSAEDEDDAPDDEPNDSEE